MPKLKKGQKVRIYQKPITHEEYEGIATLVKFVSETEQDESWMVRFRNEESTYQRLISYVHWNEEYKRFEDWEPEIVK